MFYRHLHPQNIDNGSRNMLVEASSSSCKPTFAERPIDCQPAELAKALPTVASPKPPQQTQVYNEVHIILYGCEKIKLM